MAFFHIEQIQNPNFIPLFREQTAGVPQQFPFRVKYYKTCVGLTKIRFCIEPRFTGTAAAAHKGVEIEAVSFTVEPHADMLGKEAVVKGVFVPVLFVDCPGVAPFGGAVFLASAVFSSGGEVNACLLYTSRCV